MNFIIKIGLIGLTAGIIGTAGGALLVLLLKKINDSLLSFVLGISAGIMTAIIFLDLIPEAQEIASINSTFAGIITGVFLLYLLDLLFPHQHLFSLKGEYSKYLKAGLLLSIGIALHNLPEGLAIGAAFRASSTMGFGIATLIAIHNLPEGMAVATTLSLAKLKNRTIIFITALAGVPMGLGAFIGSYLGGISDWFLSFSLAFAAGAMLYITFDELIPSAHERARGHSAITGIISGIILGMLFLHFLH